MDLANNMREIIITTEYWIDPYPPKMFNIRKKKINPDPSLNLFFSEKIQTISLIPCFLYPTTGQFKGFIYVIDVKYAWLVFCL